MHLTELIWPVQTSLFIFTPKQAVLARQDSRCTRHWSASSAWWSSTHSTYTLHCTAAWGSRSRGLQLQVDAWGTARDPTKTTWPWGHAENRPRDASSTVPILLWGSLLVAGRAACHSTVASFRTQETRHGRRLMAAPPVAAGRLRLRPRAGRR